MYKGKVVMDWIASDGSVVPPDTPNAVAVPAVIKRYSDRLLMFLLKAARPRKYGNVR
jgi:hypothetical protein